MPHHLNLFAGWSLVLASFASGAAIGLGFHRDDFLGGYASLRRRMLRLGHISLGALGLLNVIYGILPAAGGGALDAWAGGLLLAGAIVMPLVCFLTAWREPFRQLFFLPVTLLMAAVVLVLIRLRP